MPRLEDEISKRKRKWGWEAEQERDVRGKELEEINSGTCQEFRE